MQREQVNPFHCLNQQNGKLLHRSYLINLNELLRVSPFEKLRVEKLLQDQVSL